jgi:hypothetical protein
MTYLLCYVRHIDVNPITTSPVRFSHLFTQTRKVGCENRGRKFHGTFVHIQVPRGYQVSGRFA